MPLWRDNDRLCSVQFPDDFRLSFGPFLCKVNSSANSECDEGAFPMDGKQFDAISKQVASGISRRAALRGLLGAAAGLALTSKAASPLRAQSDPEDPCANCADGTICCDGSPSYCGVCCGDADCPGCETCAAGTCQAVVCGECEVCSEGACVPLACGVCEQCVGGACQPIECGDCQTCIDGVCVSSDACCGVDCGDLLCCPGGWCGECCSSLDCEGGRQCIDGLCESGPGDPCSMCPIGTGCYPDNPIGSCCPPDFALCCGVCTPWGPDIIFENCTGSACICRDQGMTCGYGIDCCDGLTCVDNVCVDGSGDPCSLCPPGTDCYPDNPHTPCCPPDFGLCCGLCMPWGPDIIFENCTGNVCICRAYGKTCGYGIDCCEELECERGICATGCTPAWHACNHDGDCCDELICDKKSRICKENAACHGPWDTCAYDRDCCSGYHCKDGRCAAPKGCIGRGYACHPKLPCCGGLACNGHTCEAPTTGTGGGGSSVTTLPFTGSGSSGDEASLTTLVAMAGVAAAAAKVLRNRPSADV